MNVRLKQAATGNVSTCSNKRLESPQGFGSTNSRWPKRALIARQNLAQPELDKQMWTVSLRPASTVQSDRRLAKQGSLLPWDCRAYSPARIESTEYGQGLCHVWKDLTDDVIGIRCPCQTFMIMVPRPYEGRSLYHHYFTFPLLRPRMMADTAIDSARRKTPVGRTVQCRGWCIASASFTLDCVSWPWELSTHTHLARLA